MITGIGIDIVEIKRIADTMRKHSRFVDKILSERELAIFQQLTSEFRQVEWLAGRFAAKEAYAKARGTGIGEDVAFKDIIVLNNELGMPVIQTDSQERIHLSISHSADYAVAQVIIES